LYTKGELSVILERSRSSILIAHPATIETAMEAARESPFIKHVILMREDNNVAPEGVVTMDSITSHDKALDETIWEQYPSTDEHHTYYPILRVQLVCPKVCV